MPYDERWKKRLKFDPLTVCDMSGFVVNYSDTRKTWDGLRVHKDWWSPKHPLLEARPPVRRFFHYPDLRPKPTPIYYEPDYGWGSICFKSEDETTWILYVKDDGTLSVDRGLFGNPLRYFYLSGWKVEITNSGTVSTEQFSGPCIESWKICSTSGKSFNLTVDGNGNLVTTPM